MGRHGWAVPRILHRETFKGAPTSSFWSSCFRDRSCGPGTHHWSFYNSVNLQAVRTNLYLHGKAKQSEARQVSQSQGKGKSTLSDEIADERSYATKQGRLQGAAGERGRHLFLITDGGLELNPQELDPGWWRRRNGPGMHLMVELGG